MAKRSILLRRRSVLKGLAAGAATAIARPAFAIPDTIKIGLVGPKTGPLALFYEEMSYAIEHFKKATGSSISINGAVHPVEFVVKDSTSNPNRASEVAQELILRDKVQIVTTFATPETVNPVADQCELNGVPCVSNDDPIDAFFFGRHGDPKKGFEWTYNFFFSGPGINATVFGAWARFPTNKVVGALWANDVDGRIFARNGPPALAKAGRKKPAAIIARAAERIVIRESFVRCCSEPDDINEAMPAWSAIEPSPTFQSVCSCRCHGISEDKVPMVV